MKNDLHKDVNKRIKNEKEHYNRGIDRRKFVSFFGHINAGPGYGRLSDAVTELARSRCEGKNVLEIGAQCFTGWVDFKNRPPQKITCINISEVELQKGIAEAKNLGLEGQIDFKLMDAHCLEFPDASLDVIFGGAILHHLEFEVAVKEFRRVLKPGGVILFVEPLGINPISKAIRFLTPNARTEDECPLDCKQLNTIRRYFKIFFSYYQFFYVPAGILSGLIFKNPDNILTRTADRLDRFVEKRLPFLKYLYRIVLIYAEKE